MHKLHKRTIVLLYGCWLTVVCGAWAGAGLWASQHHSGSSLTRSDNRAREYLRFVQFVQSRRTPDCTNCTNAQIVLLYGCWLAVECGTLGRAVVWASQHHSGSSLTYSNNWERRYLRFVQFVQSRRVARSDRCVLHQSQSESLLSIACAKSASCPGALAHAASSFTVRA